MGNRRGKEGCSPPRHAEMGNRRGGEGCSPPRHAEMGNRRGKGGCSPPGHVGISTWQGGTQPSLSCRNGLSMGVGVARLVGNRAETLDFVDGRGEGSIRGSTSPKIEPGHSVCGWWGRLQVIVIETIKYLKNGVRTLYARPLPVSRYPPSSRKVVVTSMLGGVFMGVECVDGWRIETGQDPVIIMTGHNRSHNRS